MIGPNVIAPSAARTTTGSSAGFILHRNSGGMPGQGTLTLGLAITAISGTPNLVLSVEWSFDGGATFMPADTADVFTAKTGVGSAAKDFKCKGNAYRVTWTITGTTPSLTFSVTEVQY